jgi:hypothetical protein
MEKISPIFLEKMNETDFKKDIKVHLAGLIES